MSHDTVRAPSWPGYAEVRRVTTLLRRESVGGMLLVVAALAAIIWANSPASESYFALRVFRFGYAPWHLELSVGAWAADGLLAVFFFMVGLELKREIVVGSLRRVNTAIVPVTAAVAGVGCAQLIADRGEHLHRNVKILKLGRVAKEGGRLGRQIVAEILDQLRHKSKIARELFAVQLDCSTGRSGQHS